MNEWISVKNQMPLEHDSCFAKLYGTPRWCQGMFRKASDQVIACVEYENGQRMVHEMRTHDGEWHISSVFGKCKVTHWMPVPKLPEEAQENG